MKGWAKFGLSGGGGSARGSGDGGNLRSDEGSLVKRTDGRSLDTSTTFSKVVSAIL